MLLFLTGCSSSKQSSDEEDDISGETEISEENLSSTDLILITAEEERDNDMYSPDADTTYLYWLDYRPVQLRNTTKCNIFALNTLYKAGFKTPKSNALSRDLFDEQKFGDILPVVKFKSLEDIMKGDLVIWKYHVIIFEKLVYLNKEPYAKGYWAGSRQKDDGVKVKNNTVHGNYPLKGEFVVRRPEKK